MAVQPIIDPSWHRLYNDTFAFGPSKSTPLDPTSSLDDASDSDGSEWSFTDEEELITLDLGTERVAKRALLGHAVGLDTDADTHAAPSSARTVRGSRGSGGTATHAANVSQTKPGSERHLAAGKELSITGLDTLQPLLKINDTILRGKRMDLFGSEIVLVDEFDPTRERHTQHRLQPIAPSTTDGRADVRSTTTSKRILFRPIYDPAARETSGGVDGEMYDRLRWLARSDHAYVGLGSSGSRTGLGEQEAQRLASLTDPMGPMPPGDGRVASTATENGPARAKYKRKEISEQEQMIRDAERKIRKAAILHRKQQHEQHEQLQTQPAVTSSGEANSGEDVLVDSTARDPSPPPSFDQNRS